MIKRVFFYFLSFFFPVYIVSNRNYVRLLVTQTKNNREFKKLISLSHKRSLEVGSPGLMGWLWLTGTQILPLYVGGFHYQGHLKVEDGC